MNYLKSKWVGLKWGQFFYTVKAEKGHRQWNTGVEMSTTDLRSDLLANKYFINYFCNITHCAKTGLEYFFKSSTQSNCLLCVHKQMLWSVHSSFMLRMCGICVFTQCYADMSKDLRHLIVTEYIPHKVISVTLSGFFWLQSWASTVMQCRDMEGCIPGSYVTPSGPWWTWFYYIGPDSHAASQFWKKVVRERRRTLTEGARLNGSKTSVLCTQSQSTEPLKWCRMQDLSRGLQGGTGWRRT